VRLQNKADHEKLLYLQNTLEEYTPLYDFNMLLDSIPEYAKNERVKKINQRIDALESYVEQMAKHESILKMISEMRSKLAHRLNMSITKDEFTTSNKKLENHIANIEKELKQKQALINGLELKMTDTKKETRQKLDKVEFYEENQKIWKNFDLYCAFQNLADFEGRINPTIHD
jgi:phosphopantetheine adenylyltransferase